MTFPASIGIDKLNQQHPEHRLYSDFWGHCDLLHEGGVRLRSHAEKFLVRRPKEPAEVFQQRLLRFTYQNILGTCLGWYVSKLFEREVAIDGLPQDEFWAGFLSDATRSGVAFVDLFRDVFLHLALYRTAYILTDLPRPDADEPLTLADQQGKGLLDPYHCLYSPREVINWEEDAYGNLAWVVIRSERDEQSFLGEPKLKTYWYYFNRTDYAVWEHEQVAGEKASEKREAVLTSSGKHALAAVNRVPLRRLRVPDSLWMTNRVYLQLLDHLNTENAYGWALFMSNLAMPVVIGKPMESITLSEIGYLQLEQGSSFEWTEPEGKSYQHSSDRLQSLREEIYRGFYLQAQGRSSAATPAAQSGYSKEMDMAPSQDVLNAYGDTIGEAMRLVLMDAADARGVAIEPEVRGLTFQGGAVLDEIDKAMELRQLDIPSDTLNREMQKRCALAYLDDAEPKLKQAVEKEIDAAPTLAEQQQAEAEAAAQQFASGMAKVQVKKELGGA